VHRIFEGICKNPHYTPSQPCTPLIRCRAIRPDARWTSCRGRRDPRRPAGAGYLASIDSGEPQRADPRTLVSYNGRDLSVRASLRQETSASSAGVRCGDFLGRGGSWASQSPFSWWPARRARELPVGEGGLVPHAPGHGLKCHTPGESGTLTRGTGMPGGVRCARGANALQGGQGYEVVSLSSRAQGQLWDRRELSLSRFMVYCASNERRHHVWPVYGSPTCRLAPQSSWI